MRRALGALGIAILTVVVAATSATAGAGQVPNRSAAGGVSTAVLQQRYHGWIFGSDTNPIFQEGFCGEVVDGTFFFTVATGPDVQASCSIPVGTPMVASPGGSITWQPSDGDTDAELLASLATYTAALDDPAVTLDGQPLPVGPALTQSGAYTIPLGNGSFVKAVDPNVPTDAAQLRVASAGWVVRLHPMSPGEHTLVVSDTFGGEPAMATFHITITTR